MDKQRHILSRPRCGWSTITLGDWHGRCSYIDDVAFLLLGAAEEVIETGRPVALEFDAEGYEYIIVFCSSCSYVIEEGLGNDDSKLVCEELRIEEIARMIIDDISHDLDAWVWWNYPATTEAGAAERGYRLKVELASLELRLRQHAWRKKREEETIMASIKVDAAEDVEAIAVLEYLLSSAADE